MSTDCTTQQINFKRLGKRKVVGAFDGGKITSDGGGILLREVEARTGILTRLADCFTDFRRADRTSCRMLAANQLRLYFSSFGYILIHAVRRLGLRGTEYARAQCGTIRLKFFKIGALVRRSVRRVKISFSESYPYAAAFQTILDNIRRAPLPPN